MLLRPDPKNKKSRVRDWNSAIYCSYASIVHILIYKEVTRENIMRENHHKFTRYEQLQRKNWSDIKVEFS